MSMIVKTSSVGLALLLGGVLLADESNETTGRLSVAPLDHVEYPATRPAWVSQTKESTRGGDRVVVVTRPHDTQAECAEELNWLSRAAVVSYANRLVGADTDSEFLQMTDEQIEERFFFRRYQGRVTIGGMEKEERAVELKFDEASKNTMIQQWDHLRVRKRLRMFGLVASLGAVMLIGTSGVLGALSKRSV